MSWGRDLSSGVWREWPELTRRDIKTRLIDSQPQAEAPTTLGADRRSGVDVNKQSQSSSGGCC